MSGDRRVRVFAPATVANVGAAFDVLGFALQRPGDTVTAAFSTDPGLNIDSITGDGGVLPKDPAANTATVAVQALLNELGGSRPGITLSIEKGLPIGSGLGSSAASAAAAVVAVNKLLGSPYSREQLVPFAMQGEKVACGTAHPDNVAPSILGGFTLIRSTDPLDIVRLGAPAALRVVVVTPRIELRTQDARKVLKGHVTLAKAIRQWANVAGLVAGILREDLPLIGRSLDDCIIEPERASLIPGYFEVKKSALDAGALGCTISGAGPSLFAICDAESTAEAIGEAMRSTFAAHGIGSDTVTSGINASGATIS